MIKRKLGLQPKWMVALLMAFFLAFGLGQVAALADSLGDIPLDPATYQKYLKTYTDQQREALPASYDARNDGIVTPAKNQGGCGSCWAFASVGAMESHLLKKWGYGPSDLSEQQQVSCNTEMWGCAGGNSTALQWWDEAHDNGPIDESCFPYTASNSPCSYSCGDMVTRVVDWHTVAAADFKTSCYNEGPSYWRYDVYSDFSDGAGHGFWYDANPGDVYVNTANSTRRGGHAVLIIGWDDAKGAYLCKNSWGATAGPNGDGTFWIAYSGHAHNLGFGMANFDLVNNPQQDCDYCLTDDYGYKWCLNVIKTDDRAYYLDGTCDTGTTPLKDAIATYLYSTYGLTMTAYGGSTDMVFTYNTTFISDTLARGVWVNSGSATGQVDTWLVECGAAAEAEVPAAGPAPDRK